MILEGRERLRSNCTQTLQGWTATDTEQERLRRRYLAHLAERVDGWSRTCPGAHLTASALICTADPPRVLLTLHARIGRWLQTGGHIEASDASLEAASLREAVEESGLPELTLAGPPVLLSEHEVPCGKVRPTFHLDVQYLAMAPAAQAPTFGAESLDVRWFAPDDLPEVDDSVRALVAAAEQRWAW